MSILEVKRVKLRHLFLGTTVILLAMTAAIFFVVHIVDERQDYVQTIAEPEPYHQQEARLATAAPIDIYQPATTPFQEDTSPDPLLNLIKINRPMPLFENKNDGEYLLIIPPQDVEVLDSAENWRLINTDYGPKWINLDFTPRTDNLESFFSQFGSNLGIYYKNLETGFTYSFNPDRIFFGASVNKATHGLYTYIAAERGYIDMYKQHTFRQSDYWGGSGIIRFMNPGVTFTTRELLHYSVVYSDNIAYRILARYMDTISFSYLDFVQEIGANPRFMLDRYSVNASVYDAALWLYEIQNYFNADNRYSHYFRMDMHNTAVYSHPYFTRGRAFGGPDNINVQFIHSDYPVAQKFGWGISAFNVMAIVDAPSPFILAIFSNMENGAHDLFEEISWLMQEFNERYFVGYANR